MGRFGHREAESVTGVSLLDSLFVFVGLAASPDPAALSQAAINSIQQHPLQSLLMGVHYDKDGKVVHRSQAVNLQGDPGGSAVQREISQQESIRRNVISTAIEVARRNIMIRHFLPEELIVAILQHSAFVPKGLVLTYSRAFLRFFQGDFTTALYTLTPLLEGSLRHVLKINGHDVSIFDDETQPQHEHTTSTQIAQKHEELNTNFPHNITTHTENCTDQWAHLSATMRTAPPRCAYSPDAIYACWLIFRLCVLPLFPYREQLRSALQTGGLGWWEELD
jgi:hypothetical protein